MADNRDEATAGEPEEAGVETETPDAPSNPEERAFTGHPDHPPATPDQPVKGNEELLRREEEPEA